MFESLSLSDLPHHQCGVLREPSSTRPSLWLIEENGVRAIVKDYSTNGFFYRNTVGRFLVWRESKAYRKLKGLHGVPNFYRVIDGLAIVVEHIPGRSMEGLEQEMRLADEFFQRLRELVEDVHRRSLAHCDLKRAPNILLGYDGNPYIIDWSASISQKEFLFFPLNLIYKRFLLDDLNGIIKIQLRHSPDTLTDEEKNRYFYRSRAERLIRALRDSLRDLLQKIA